MVAIGVLSENKQKRTIRMYVILNSTVRSGSYLGRMGTCISISESDILMKKQINVKTTAKKSTQCVS